MFAKIKMITVALALLASPALAWGRQWRDEPEIGALFEKAAVSGTFVVFDREAERLTGHSQARAETRFTPASTFKIANSLIGLSVGAVSGVDEPLPYGGQPQAIKAWERDMGLREAIRISNVPIYRELARRVGLERMRAEVRRLDYGNGEVGVKVDSFWLEGPLRVSAVEQVLFISRLAKGELPLPKEAQACVREILWLESGPNWSLYAKTGMSTLESPGVGWWVGWLERGDKIYPFAINIDIDDPNKDGPKRLTLARDALKLLGLME
ncbi:MAG: class D beta-lactamase [Deltaproteobacteria bacterium]|jgi:beta-lactamase class D|nr:class D beta-lactamase [Deltaproteobacteria bacterium]